MTVSTKGFLFFLVAFLPLTVFAQFSNSWIKLNQQYFKIPVAQEGIYRLTQANLQAVGFPVNGDPRYIQIFHRGQEQSIYIKGQADGAFNSSDFIEFYGQKNDGTLDSLLYQQHSLQPHKYYNLYSDTTAYFLTYSYPNSLGIRMDSVQLTNSGGLPAETYQFSQRLFVFHDQYNAGLRASDLTYATTFDLGEGWTGNALQQGQTIDYTIDSLINGVSSAGNPKLELLLVGRDYPSHSLQVLVGPDISTLRVIASPNIDGFNTFLLSSDLNWSDIGSDGKMVVRIAALAATTNRYQASASYAKVTFPQNFNWGGQKKKGFRINPKVGSSFFSIANPPANLRLWDISDIQNIKRVKTITANPNPFTAIVPGDVSQLYSSSEIITPQIIPVAFHDFSNSTANYLIITNKALRSPSGDYSDPVKAYASYRASSIGGNYDTLIVNVDQLYDQFNYGEVSPLAIYSFMKFMTQNQIKYLFLIGKGRDVTYSGYQRKSVPPTEFRDLVPSAGYPGGDIAFTSGLGGTTYYPLVPTGRLTATTPAQVVSYLSKVKELEKQSIQPWAKQLLHLSGGASAFDLHQFRQFVDGYKTIAEGPYLGGHVTTQSKSNVDIEKINVSPIVNQGVNLVTFFGHSSSSTIDIDIGYVSDPTLGYNNAGKYPVFLINGCNAGTIFANSITFSEDWMLATGKGSRNFIAGTSFGWAGDLNNYSKLFYTVGFGDSTFIAKGIGDIQKEASKRYLDSASINIFSVAQVQQMVLAGDPALKLFGTNHPDYALDNSSISVTSLDSKPVTSLSDSFALKIIVKNLGAYYPKPVKVRVIRTFNDNSTKTYDSTYSPILYIDTLTFKIKKENSTNGFGNNLFTVIIDPLNTIKELNETNNIGTLNTFIPSNGTINLYPTNYSIVNSTSLNLTLQDANLLGTQRSFYVQIDTVSTFNSSFLQQQTVSGKIFAKTAINILAGDSIVYYWRTKPVKQNASDSAMWTVSSFIHINNSPEGWAQTKFPQLTNDALVNLQTDINQSKINFTKTIAQLNIKSIGVNSGSLAINASMKVDGFEYNVQPQQVGIACRYNTINLVAFNKQTATPYPGISVYWNDARGCGYQPSVINSFLSSELQAGDGINLLRYVDNIRVSDSVVLYSVGNPGFSTWPSNVLTKLNDLGISTSQITSLTDGEPVIIRAKKGAAIGSAKIFRASQIPATSQDLALTSTISGSYTTGKIKSPLIGPAKTWNSFNAKTNEIETVDKVTYSIYGVSLNGQETLIQSSITNTYDLSSVDPIQFPLLKVQVNLQDSINQSASQLKKWFVFYESVADGLLFYPGSTDKQSVQEGETFTSQYGFTNISPKLFSDSLLVNLETHTLSNAHSDTHQFKIKAPLPGDTTRFSISINTRGKAGLNNVTVFVNPKIQPEQYYENNLIGLAEYLDVIADKALPTLDVTVDNRYLLNDDYVSTSPIIRTKLHDDNPFLFVTDTTHLNIFLSYPCTETPCPFQRIAFSRSDVQWLPASASSDFMVSFHPNNLTAGTYTLQVAATDASGNTSGVLPYQVNFQVKTETTLSLNSVYPNPSSDGFNFNFLLSGNKLPDEFELQLFSREGQLLQQFGLDDVSNFIIGNNNIYWSSAKSGLGNGLIVYKLTISADGKTASQSGRLLLMK
jgi:hypothetical protein